MRFVALGVILLSLPLFVAWLQSGQKNRDIAMTLMGALVFVTGTLQVDAALITWPMWSGTSRGILIAPADMLALALLLTRKRSGKGMPFTWLLAAYLGVIALSATYSRNPLGSMFSVWDFGRVFLVFLAVGGELARPTAYPALLRGFSLGLMLQAGFVVQQKLSGVVQAAGSMEHQNQLGMMTELVLLNLLAAMLEGERNWLVRLGVLAGAIIVAAGGSRGAMGLTGAAAVLLILVSLMRNRTSGKVALAGAGALIILAAVPVAMITLKDRFGDHSVFTEEDQRGAMERAARAVSADYPLGVGVNLYPTVARTDGYSQRVGVSWYGAGLAVPVHNAYLLIRAEAGYQGQAVFLLLLVVPMVAGLLHAFRYRRSRSDGWPLGSAIALGTIAIHSNFEFNALIYSVQLPLAMNIAIIAGRIRASRIERAARRAGASEAVDEDRRRRSGLTRLPRPSSTGLVARLDGMSADSGLPRRINQETKR